MSEARKDYLKQYYQKNKDKYNKDKEYAKTYYIDNKDKYNNDKEYIKAYQKANRDAINATKRLRIRERKANDNLYRIRTNIRQLIRATIQGKGYKKSTKTEQILGCTFQQFKEHLESQFESWMCWDNYGNPKDGIFEPNKTWDIDHIKPVSVALTESEIVDLNHYTNLKPLCSYYNRWIKKDNI